MSAPRIVAVCGLMGDIMADLSSRPRETLSPAERAFFYLLDPGIVAFDMIRHAATREMQAAARQIMHDAEVG